MTAHLFSAAIDSQFGLTPKLQKRSSRSSRQKQPNKNRRSNAETLSHLNPHSMSQDALWTVLLDTVPIGVMLLTDGFQLVYCNQHAKQVCDRIEKDNTVPGLIRALCQRLLEEGYEIPEPIVMECQDGMKQFFRLQVRWINLTEQTLLLVHLEDCHASLQEELTIEQVKYDLTDREAEVWCLLRQEYSYQEISDLLSITLNTVKTHVKNIYAKRKNLASDQKIWYSR